MKSIWKKVYAVGSAAFALFAAAYYFIYVYFKTGISQFTLKDFSLTYWGAVLAVFALFSVICLVQLFKKREENNMLDDVLEIFTKYRFLLRQLVSKEFKLKYRRSYLGVAWSLINPLLMMIVISAVFSYIFRFNIEHFPAYLILGQTTFNFFSEATQLSLLSVVNSGQLIKKVYMPKYIFPISRVFSSFINCLFTLIPAVLVLLYYGIYPSLTNLFLPVFFVYFFIFTLGVSLILATADVFMRDIQHLYAVFITALSYATPIFYPIDSLSDTMKTIMNFNPLYHYLKYMRNILFYHQCPSVLDNVICLGLAVVALVIGIRVFVKNQNKFILHI